MLTALRLHPYGIVDHGSPDGLSDGLREEFATARGMDGIGSVRNAL